MREPGKTFMQIKKIPKKILKNQGRYIYKIKLQLADTFRFPVQVPVRPEIKAIKKDIHPASGCGQSNAMENTLLLSIFS
jgi:hypothetical protein